MFNVAGPINLRPPNKPIQSKIFLLELNPNERAKFIDTHKKKDHFSVMSMGEFEGTAFVDQEAVLEVFYKKTHKDQYSKGLWLTLYPTLSNLSHVTVEGTKEADRLADQGRQLHPRFPHPRTPSLLLSVAGTPCAPQKSKLLTPDMSPLPVKRLDFCAQESLPLIHSIEGGAILTTLYLTLMADALSTTSDISHRDTDSWSAENSDNASQLSSRTCSTEGSRD